MSAPILLLAMLQHALFRALVGALPVLEGILEGAGNVQEGIPGFFQGFRASLGVLLDTPGEPLLRLRSRKRGLGEVALRAEEGAGCRNAELPMLGDLLGVAPVPDLALPEYGAPRPGVGSFDGL
mmetsp:Transcript_19671/g.54632  ORF Transcript_19671/g.54632 Transcript_19671/m.54632 type:complete len:124 (+) Transcript_19671:1113-1484(+)